MTSVIRPFQLLVIALTGWFNRHQQAVIDDLIEENCVLKEQLEGQRLRFTDEQRMRLAVKAKLLGRRLLDEIETLVTPCVLFFIRLETRTVHSAGVTTALNGEFMKQMIRNLTDVEDGILSGSEFLIMDRDKK